MKYLVAFILGIMFQMIVKLPSEFWYSKSPCDSMPTSTAEQRSDKALCEIGYAIETGKIK
jgi:hypothetical protein